MGFAYLNHLPVSHPDPLCLFAASSRFMIGCDSCHSWFHGDCIGVDETQGRELEKNGQEYTCPPCTTKKQLQSEPLPEPEPELSFSECVTPSPPGEGGEEREEQQAPKVNISFRLSVMSCRIITHRYNK